LEDACEHLADYMESYWRATHPPVKSPPRIKRNPMENRGPAMPFTPSQIGLNKLNPNVPFVRDAINNDESTRYQLLPQQNLSKRRPQDRYDDNIDDVYDVDSIN
jgi:hypothetical protein